MDCPLNRGDCIVAFAAGSGSSAFVADGTAEYRNSFFTAALLECISARGHLDDMRTLLQDHVRAKVVAATHGAQVPWVTASMDPAPRYIVLLGSCQPLHPVLAPGVTIGDVVLPLSQGLQEQVCALFPSSIVVALVSVTTVFSV
jgi:hypothetical protein